MNDLMKRMAKISSKNAESMIMSSTDYGAPEHIPALHQYLFNIIFSGKVRGTGAGLAPGLHMLAGPSKSAKSVIGWNLVKDYLDVYEESGCIYYDSEFGSKTIIDNLNIDKDRVIVVPALDVETVKKDMVQKLKGLNKNEKVIFFFDSLGMVPSAKEVEDAEGDKTVTDMSRAKAIKSLLRMVTPRFSYNNVPAVFVNHTGMSIGGMFPQEGQTGGQATTLAPNTVVFFGKAKINDEGDDNSIEYGFVGSVFKLKMNKSRTIKENMVFDMPWRFGSNRPNKYTGLYELAMKTDDIFIHSKGWRSVRIVDMETGEITADEDCPKFREKDIRTDPEFWEETMFEKTAFIKNVEQRINL